MSWFESFMFTLGWQLHKADKREKREAKKIRAFFAECEYEFESALNKLDETTSLLIAEAGPIGLDDSFFNDLKLAPFYPIGEVLSSQGKIYPKQESLLETLLLKNDPRYNHAQFVEATIHRTGIYKEYWDVVGLQRDFCGSLWLTLFELVYRTRNTDAFQDLVDSLHSIVIYFYNLGDPDTVRPSLICDRIMENMNGHVNSYQQTQYIHALMLLQKKLLGKKHLEIKDHYLVYDSTILKDSRNYYIFDVYQKETNQHCGKYAVRKIRLKNGKPDYEQDGDQIFVWNTDTNSYDLFYQELI